MNVAVVENWADLEGTVVKVSPPTEKDAWASLTLHVLAVHAVPGYANLFEWAPGQQVTLKLPQAVAAAKIRVGARVRLRARRGGPINSFADPDRIEIL